MSTCISRALFFFFFWLDLMRSTKRRVFFAKIVEGGQVSRVVVRGGNLQISCSWWGVSVIIPNSYQSIISIKCSNRIAWEEYCSMNNSKDDHRICVSLITSSLLTMYLKNNLSNIKYINYISQEQTFSS